MITEEQKIAIRKFEQILKKGYYASGAEVTKTYNEVFGTKLNTTNCNQCIISRVKQLVERLNAEEKKEQEALKKEEPNDSPQGENKTTTEAENKPRKVGRPKAK